MGTRIQYFNTARKETGKIWVPNQPVFKINNTIVNSVVKVGQTTTFRLEQVFC